ncbi:MAG: TetR/AcrR family transcriptional regulator [Acidimicrobiia bacterium]
MTPARTPRSARAAQVLARAMALLESEGPEALTMRRLADELGMRAPSLYKHFRDKAALEAALVEEALAEVGAALHRAVARPGRRTPVAALLTTYRRECTARPHAYRLATAGPLDRAGLPAGLEDWAGEPFFLATGDPHRAQALWALAHGMVVLEIDHRFLPGSDLARTWAAAAAAFGG